MFQGPFVQPDGNFAYGAVGNVLMSSQNGEVTAKSMRDLMEFQAEVLREHPSGTCFIAHISSLKMPDSETRDVIAESMRRYQHSTLKQAIVLDQEGFVGSIVRSILSSVSLVARTKNSAAQRYFPDFAQAVDYVADVAAPAVLDHAAIQRGIDSLREAVG